MTRSAYDVLSELRQRERDVDDLRAELARVLEPVPGLDRLARDMAAFSPSARRLTREAVDEVLEVRLTPDGERALDEELGAVIDVDEHEDHLDLLDSQMKGVESLLEHHAGDIRRVNLRVDEHERWRVSWAPTTTELVGRVAKLEANRDEHAGRVDSLEEAIDQRVDSSLELRKRVEALERGPRVDSAVDESIRLLGERLARLEQRDAPVLDRVGAELELHKRLEALEAWRETLASAYPHIGDPRAS